MLLKINDKREESIRGLENSLRSVNLNGTIKVDGKYKDYTYMIKEVYYYRIENQYLLEIDDEIITELAKKYRLYFELNDHSIGEEQNDSGLLPVHYYTIDLIDIRPKRFVDVTIKNFGVREDELLKVDTMSIPNEILEVCDLLSEKYNKINIELNSENTIAEISVERNDGREVGVKFISNNIGVYGEIEKDVQFILFNRSTSSNTYDFFPVYVNDLLHKDILNLKNMGDRIYDLCSRIIYIHNESK